MLEFVTLNLPCADCHGAVEVNLIDWAHDGELMHQTWRCPYCERPNFLSFPATLVSALRSSTMSSAQFPSTCPRCGLHEVTVIKEVEGLEERHVGVCYKCGYRWQIPPKEA